MTNPPYACHPERSEDPPHFDRSGPKADRRAPYRLSFTLWAFLYLCCAWPAHAQGCAQCLDSTRATPPQVQAAYRHAIYLLGGAGAALFVLGTLIIRRNR